jgi:hypothetical protein
MYLAYRQLRDDWPGDRCLLEGTRRLRQDAAVKGGSSHERNSGLDQKDALHVRTSLHRDKACDLPADVLRQWGTRPGRIQDHFIVAS